MLQNKAAVITGGARGIGGATVELFVQHGCKVGVLKNFLHKFYLIYKI